MTVKTELLKAIREQRKGNGKKKKFRGSLMDYVELVQQNPELSKSSHKRLYDAIVKHGSEKMPDSDPRKHKIFDGNSLIIYDYFKEEIKELRKMGHYTVKN